MEGEGVGLFSFLGGDRIFVFWWTDHFWKTNSMFTIEYRFNKGSHGTPVHGLYCTYR